MKKKLLIYGLFIMIFCLFTGCSTAGGYYRSGKKCFLSGNYEEAAANFAAAIQSNPNRAEYYIDYGMTLIAMDRYDEAIAQFDRVYMNKDILMVKRNNKRALRGEGIAYYNMQQYEEAIRQFEEALAIRVLSELDLDILYYKGNALLIMGAYEEARDTYTRIIETFGNKAEALGKRAYTCRKTGEYDKSLADYDMAISIEKDCYDYYFGKYDLLTAMQDETGAAAVLEQAAAIEAVSKEDRYNQAKIHYYQGIFDLALSELSEGFAQGFPGAYFYIGEIYAKQKDYSTAIYYYEKYIDKGDITETAVYNQIAYCYMKQEDYDKALDYLETGIHSGDAAAMKVLKKNSIIALEHLGQYDAAQEKLLEYLESYPEDRQAAREKEFIKTRNIDFLTEAVQ